MVLYTNSVHPLMFGVLPIVMCSGSQHEACKAHTGVFGPEETTAVCSPQWPASLLPWQLVSSMMLVIA